MKSIKIVSIVSLVVVVGVLGFVIYSHISNKKAQEDAAFKTKNYPLLDDVIEA